MNHQAAERQSYRTALTRLHPRCLRRAGLNPQAASEEVEQRHPGDRRVALERGLDRRLVLRHAGNRCCEIDIDQARHPRGIVDRPLFKISQMGIDRIEPLTHRRPGHAEAIDRSIDAAQR